MPFEPPAPAVPPPGSTSRWHLSLAALLMVLGAALSLWGWQSAADRLRQQADAEFDRFSELTFSNIGQHVAHQMDLLASFQALFRSNTEVTRAEFHRLYEDMRVSARFPGVKAIQYSRLITEAQRPAFEAAVRQEGYPQFSVHPAGPRPQYMAVVYNEPMAGNEPAFGHDNAAEASRREVMERARDTGQAQASPPMMLLQERPGVVVRLPVYRHGMPQDTLAQRRAAHIGQISGVLLVEDLLRDTLPTQQQAPYQVVVMDHGPVEPAEHAPLPAAALVVKTAHDVVSAGADSTPVLAEDRREHTLAMAGRTWTVDVARPHVNHALAPLPLLLLGGGLALSLFLSLTVGRLTWLHRRAQSLARVMSEQAHASANRLDAVINSTADGIITLSEQGTMLTVNAAAQRLFGRRPEHMVGQDVGLLMPPAHALPYDESAQWLATGRSHQVTACRADGSLFPIEISVNEVEIDGERQLVALLRDLTETQQAQARIAESARALQAANELREAVFEHAAFALVVMNPQGLIQAMNPAAERLLDCCAADEVGQRSLMAFHDEVGRHQLQQILQQHQSLAEDASAMGMPVAHSLRSIERQMVYLRADGSTVPVSVTLSALHDIEGQITGYLSISYDITERQRLAEQLSRLAFHDALTGLPNRLLLEEHLTAAIARSRETGQPLALLFIDLDHFKPINDTHGHAVGDQVLCEVARRLQATLRGADLVARIGGDEFVVLLSTLSQAEDCAVVADKLIHSLSQPMEFGELVLHVGASLGVARYPDGGTDAATLLRGADAAMYAVKQAGRLPLAHGLRERANQPHGL